ncbi:MAG: NB-ARC domain-containing protein, partial [Anaerolineales bacterium]
MGKTWAIVFILLGLALLLAAVTFWADTLTMEEPPSLGQTVRDWLVTLAGLGSSLAGWLSLLKEKPKESKDSAGSAPTTVTDNAQAAIGPGSRAIQTAGDYYEGGTHIHLPPETPQAGDTIGYIPPYKTETYIHRGQIEDEVREFLRKGNGVGAILGLHAPGGLGKTELARRAAEDLKTEFEGVLWVDVGDKAAPQVVTEMLTRLGVQLPPGASYEQQKTALHARLRGHRYLILFDDVRQKALDGLQDFLPAKPCAALITSRIQQIGGVHKTFMLDRMTPEQARQLLEAILGPETVAAEAEAAAHLAARCAFNPLALEIAARRIRQLQGFSRPIARYFEMVRDRFPELKMDGDARWDLELVFDISYLDLNEADRARFRALAVFHPSGFAPEAAAHIWGVETSAARQVLSRFINLSLVKPVAGDFERYRLHDLLDEYAALKLERAGEAETLNARLAEWLENLFEQHSMDDPSTAPEAALEIENLRRALAWAGRQKDGNRLAGLIRAARNWFVVLNLYAEWGAAAEKALSLGISEKQTKANVLKAIGDVQQFRKQL